MAVTSLFAYLKSVFAFPGELRVIHGEKNLYINQIYKLADKLLNT